MTDFLPFGLSWRETLILFAGVCIGSIIANLRQLATERRDRARKTDEDPR